MSKQLLIDQVAKKTNCTKAQAAEAVNAVLETIEATLVDEGKLAILGFGNFTVKERSAREGRNPSNGETIQIAASKTVTFKPGKALKDKLV